MGYSVFTTAWDEDDGIPIHIRNLPLSRNGNKCNCSCVECNEPLQACQGEERDWYFRHQNVTSCHGGPMTALHLMAQHLLTGDHAIKTSKGPVSYVKGQSEFNIADTRKKADVSGIKLDDNDRIYLEILVTHEVEVEKRDLYQKQKLHSIEIDISQVDPHISDNDLLQLLLNDVSLQNVIYTPEMEKEVVQTEDSQKTTHSDTDSNFWNDVITGGALIGLFYMLGKSLLGFHKKRVPRKNIKSIRKRKSGQNRGRW